MSFALLRAPLRKAVFTVPIPKAQLRTSFRRFSTAPPPEAPKKSNTGLFIGIGAAVAVGGFAFYYFGSGEEAGTAIKSGVQIAKVKVNFVPSQADYQKVSASGSNRFQDS
jgi:cytochrome c peroxidase